MASQAVQTPADEGRLSIPAQAVVYAAVILGAVVMLLPFIWMVSTACKPTPELSRLPIRFLPAEPACMENLTTLYELSDNFNGYLANSALLTIGRLVGQLVTCSLAAYGFARFRFPGRNLLFALSLGLLMVPFQAIVVQEYLLLNHIDWLNTYQGLIVPGMFSAFALFLLRQAFLQIPIELEEAAVIDGANPLQILRHVTLPLSAPALAAFTVITVQAAWNDFLFPLVAASQEPRVVTIGIALLQGQRSTPFNLIMMGSLIATIPMLVMFVALQRYFIEGVAMTGVKR